MGWIRKSPFASGEDPVEHILGFLAKEAELADTPLTEAERSILIAEWDPETPIAEELHAKARNLVELVVDHESDVDDPRNLGNSLAWASESGYSNVSVLAEEVIRSRGERLPRLRGRWIIDRIQLVGCGFAAVILIGLFWVALDLLFDWK